MRNDLKLAKETHESDKALWLVERTHFKASTETNDYDNDDKVPLLLISLYIFNVFLK